MVWDMTTTTCGLATIPASDKVLGRDSDLHLYLTHSNDPNSNYLVFAGWCKLLKGIGATHGMVNFNLSLLETYDFSDPI
jgi:leishmanolysin